MGLTVHFEVLNQLGTPMLYSSTLATRPAAGITGRIFYRTDSPFGIYRDNGVTWDLISSVGTSGSVTGTGVATRVAYWDTTSSISSDAGLYFDVTNVRLGIGTITPGSALDAHQASGTIIQANATGLGNSLQSFQLQGSGKWQIGNVYNAGANYFRVFDQLNSVERIVQQNTGELDQTGWIVNTNTVTGITGTVTTQLPNSSFTNNFTFNSGISTIASLNTIGLLVDNNLNFSGATTINSTSYNTAGLVRTNLTFGTAAGTLTYTQASGGIRALTNQQSIYIQIGANSGTISHYANFQVFGDQKFGAGLTTFTNRYQILLNDYTEFSAGNTYTNRWSIYQVGASNTNYFNGKIISGSSTTVSTFQLDITGTSRLTGSTTITGSTTATSASAVGITLSPTLVASANSDKLAALIIQPTFLNGGFTNVTNMPFSIITLGSLDVTRFGTSTAYINSTFNTDGSTQDYITHGTTGSSGKIFQFGASATSTTPGISFLSTTEMGLSFNNTSLNISDCSSTYPGTRKQTFFRSSGSILIQNGGTHTEDTSAMLNVVSTTKGFLPPRMSTTQKNAITTPSAGLVIFDITLSKLCVYSGAAWQTITSV